MHGARDPGDRGRRHDQGRHLERQSHKSETDSQASPKMQRDKSVAYIRSQDNWTHIDTDYSDVGLSGYDPDVIRPGFERLMEDAKAKKFDAVVIYMLSRLTRQGAAEALKIQQEPAKHGVALVSTQEPFINTSDDNPFGVAFFALIAGLAHQESKNKSKFIRDAFAQLKSRGSHSSGPVPFGFKADATQVDGLTIRVLSPGDRSAEPTGPQSTPADAVELRPRPGCWTGERTFLGSWGKLRCAKCDTGMTVSNIDGTYVCNLRRAVGSVPRHVLRTPQTETDQIIAERVWARLSALDPSDPDGVELLAVAGARFAKQGADPEAAEELAEQEARLAHVQQSIKERAEDRESYEGPPARRAFAETMSKYADHEERCVERIAELSAASVVSTRLPLDEWTEHGDGDPFGPGGIWSRRDVDERRAFLDVFVDHITVAPVTTKRGTTRERTDTRLDVVWVKPAEELEFL
ncbi:recombinase family protein [Streptomyces sp. NPDC002825]|uniref:recombinase family protein n=1 Tax=Streptomyces sp. NPDC002825 TaxID=3154666 RepID=UPI00332C3690